MAEPLKKIFLIRHAESLWNSERRVQGACLEIPLSPAGRVQAEMLGERLRLLSFDSVFCSDANRAVETARVALGHDYPITTLSDLRELSLGDWEGRLISEIREEFPDKVDRWYRKPTTVEIDGGENIFSFRERSVRVIERIIGACEKGKGNTVVVTHGGIICSYLTHIFNMDLDDLWCFSLPNASITTVVLDFRVRLRSFGDTSHLEGDAVGLDGMPSSI